MQRNNGDIHLSGIGALLGDPRRARIITTLMDGRSLAATTLASEAGIAASTASQHLHKLVDGGLLKCVQQGKRRYYRLSGPQIGRAIEGLATITPAAPVRSLDQGTQAHALRYARSCYDHLAGRLGVALLDALIAQGAVRQHDEDTQHEPDPVLGAGRDYTYELTEPGYVLLSNLGITLPKTKRPLTKYCIDWSEQRPHVGGQLGAVILTKLLNLGWLQRAPRGRGLVVTAIGREMLVSELGLPKALLVIKPYTKS